jgi:hypothetical protein
VERFGCIGDDLILHFMKVLSDHRGRTLDLASSSAARASPVVISVGHATPTMPAPRSTGAPRGRVAPALPRPPRGGELGPRQRALRAA